MHSGDQHLVLSLPESGAHRFYTCIPVPHLTYILLSLCMCPCTLGRLVVSARLLDPRAGQSPALCHSAGVPLRVQLTSAKRRVSSAYVVTCVMLMLHSDDVACMLPIGLESLPRLALSFIALCSITVRYAWTATGAKPPQCAAGKHRRLKTLHTHIVSVVSVVCDLL